MGKDLNVPLRKLQASAFHLCGYAITSPAVAA